MKRLKIEPNDVEAAKRTRDRDARFPPVRRRRESGRGAFGLVDFVRHICSRAL